MIAILISGPKGSGKTTAALFIGHILKLELWSARVLIESNIKDLGLPINHRNKLLATEKMRSSTTSGSIFETSDIPSRSAVVDAVISKADLEYCSAQFDKSYHLNISAETPLRLSRIHSRDRSDDRDLTVSELQHVETRDDVFSLNAAADFSITNNQSLRELHSQLNEFIAIFELQTHDKT